MNFIEKYNCILCKYNKYNKNGDSCFNHQEKDEYDYPIVECKSLSNVYYGTLIKYFPFKQIYNICTEITYKKEEKYNKEMNKKYGDYSLENDDIKFIWGVKSGDDLSGSDANLYTMNDIDIVYNKKENKYMLGIETAYIFENQADGCSYLKDCLAAFTKYMDDNGLKKNEPYRFFMNDLCTSMEADSIEEMYTNFKIFVDGFCNQYLEDKCEVIKFSNENWISIEETKPDVQLCIDNHSIYFISNPIRIKTKSGYDFIARYKILMADYNSNIFMKESWKICGLNFEITNNEVEYWMELPDEYEGE